MTGLPADRQYALRHGTTGRVWRICEHGLWLFNTPGSVERAWTAAKQAGLVESNFSDHKVIVIKLVEVEE